MNAWTSILAASCASDHWAKLAQVVETRPAKFRYVSNFTTASCGFSATARPSCWSLSADSELSVKKSDRF